MHPHAIDLHVPSFQQMLHPISLNSPTFKSMVHAVSTFSPSNQTGNFSGLVWIFVILNYSEPHLHLRLLIAILHDEVVFSFLDPHLLHSYLMVNMREYTSSMM